MVIIYKNLELLKNKIETVYEVQRVNKRVGVDTTFVVEVDRFNYNPKYPILDGKRFSEWAVNRSRVLASSASAASAPNPTDPNVTDQATSNSNNTNHIDTINATDTSKASNVEHREHNEETRDIENADNAPDGDGAPQEKARSEFDTLIINENFEDEYRCFGDGDSEEEESELSKNLKKIRTQSHNTEHSNQKTQPNKPFQKQSNQVSQPQPQQPTDQTVSQLHQQQEPAQQAPDWKELSKQLEESSFDKYRLIYQHLNHHKNETKLPTSQAHALLKEVILKCFSKDESFQLLDFFEIFFECDCRQDEIFLKFIVEIVQRLRRKINPHANLHIFQSKVSAEVVMNNYRLALRRIAQYIKDTNLRLNLLFCDFEFLYQCLEADSKPRNPQLVKKEEPRENLAPMDSGAHFAPTKPQLTGSDASNILNLNSDKTAPIGVSQLNASEMKGGDFSTGVQRIVVNHINPIDGRPCFKVTARRSSTGKKQLRKRL